MIQLKDYLKFGISPSMLHPASFNDPLEHFAAVDACCRYGGYESMETFLPADAVVRKKEIARMQEVGIALHYNTPLPFQIEGDCNPGSDDAAERANALRRMKLEIDYAGEAASPLIVMTACPDYGAEKRPVIYERYCEYFYAACTYAKQYKLAVVIEPIERDILKKLMLGPTTECAAFIQKMQGMGCDNAQLMIDFAHLPLMGETPEQAVLDSISAGIGHVHMGDAMLDSASVFYGHTHPPVALRGGEFGFEQQVQQFALLLDCGYLPSQPVASGQVRPTVSLEVRPYVGVSPQTSAQFMLELMQSAFAQALTQHLKTC